MRFLRPLIALTVLVLIGVTACALATSGTTFRTAPDTAPTAATLKQSDDGPLQAELLTVHSMGFDPAEITRPPGPFLLVVENRSGADLGALQLLPVDESSQQPGAPLLEVSIGKDEPNWSRRVDLPTGTYVLKQVDEPGWSCKITVTP
jgi:hypothetical protein